MSEKKYVSRAQMGNCMVCGDYKDLRCGVCFHCCEKVSGRELKKGGKVVGHELYEIEKPENSWVVGV